VMFNFGLQLFPILGGRLLKGCTTLPEGVTIKVSNPWREAIEGRFGNTNIDC